MTPEMSTVNLAILSLYFHPDSGANSVIVTKLAQRLAARGYGVSAICGMPHYEDHRIWPSYRGKVCKREQLGKIGIYHTWLYLPAQKSRIWGRLLSYISFNILSALMGLFAPRPDVILAPSPPLTIGLAAWFIGLMRRAPYIYNVQDVYPDIAVRLGALKNRHLIRLFSWMELFVYRRAAAVSVICEGFRQTLIRKGVPGEKIAVIPNCVDTDYITPRARDNAFARREGLVDRFVVLFAGNAGLSQGLEDVLAAAKALGDHREILFLLVGNGAAKPALEAQAAEMGLGNVRFMPFQPWEEVPGRWDDAIEGLPAQRVVEWCQMGIEEALSVAPEAAVSGGATLGSGESAFASSTGVAFTVFGAGRTGELARGGRYLSGREPATGMTLYPDAMLRAVALPPPRPRVFLPLGAEDGQAAALRAQGLATVAQLSPAETPQGLRCTHVMDSTGRAVPVGE